MSRESQKLLQTVHTVFSELEKRKFKAYRNYCDTQMDSAIRIKKDGITEADNIIFYTKNSYDMLDRSFASDPSMFLGIMTTMVPELYRVCDFHKLNLGSYKPGDTQVMVKIQGRQLNKPMRNIC